MLARKELQYQEGSDTRYLQSSGSADIGGRGGGGGGAGEGPTSGGSTGGSTTNPVSTIYPSRTAIEDAAKAIDRYTKSLRDAETAAAATQSVVQFVQNNTSPIALTASEIYRQSRNLLHAQEIKMGGTT